MRLLSWIVLVVEAIVAIVAAVTLFMIFSPSVTISPTLALTGAVEGIFLLALGNFALAIVAVVSLRQPPPAPPQVLPLAPQAMPEHSANPV